MPDAVTHPTLHELIAFGLGKLPEGAAAVVAAHLEICPTCRQAVANVTPDSFLGKVRDAGPHGSSFPPALERPVNAPNRT
ncbi:MAG TPA: zf-HC2 domain-containing protein, partial [Gemmataceae bacterium]|nr:zf-HC2 domain-containing protein [Gemmataceae bacterium]